MRKFLAATTTAAALVAAGALPAVGATGDTTVTLASVDTLTIVAPAAAVLTTSGTTASGSLGLTTVMDPTGGALTGSVSLQSDFAQVGGSDTIAAAAVTACSSTPTLVGATGGLSTVVVTSSCPTKVALGTMWTLTTSALSTFTYTPEISVDGSGAAAGVYIGTIRQTVS